MSKTALITGASRGFGAAMAEALAADGTHVIALARTTGALEELDDRIQAKGGQATLVPLDINDEQGLQRLCLSIHERWGGLDIWLHAAIFAAPLSPAAHVPEKDWRKTVDTNIHATQRLIANVEPLLIAKGGRAILPVDPAGGQSFFGAYGSSKVAQKALFDSWANETRKANITITTFTPAPMPTATRGRFHPGEDRSKLSHPHEQAARLMAQL